MISLGGRLDRRNGVGPGFDHLRVGLSLTILFWHSFGLSYGAAWVRTNPAVIALQPFIATLLAMFFALSGFLVMGSALRINDLRTFITFRVLRIVPALATEISLSALVLGPLLTAYPLSQYFSDPKFVTYFGSLIGRVSYVLPGLFLDSPYPEVVNGALWTVGPEILCYVIMALVILTAAHLRPGWLLAVAGGYLAICLASDAVSPPAIAEILPTKALVFAYLAGNLLYHARHRLPWSPPLALVAFALSVLLIAGAHRGGFAVALSYPAAALLAYVVAVIGIANLPRMPFFHRGDYSYGIYIFGYPIQQTVTQFLPEYRVWWINFGLALPVTLLFAVASWHLIEKPALGLRKRVLRTGTPAPPRPPIAWGARTWAVFVLLCGYGLFVATASHVFPLGDLFAWTTGTTVRASTPQPGF